MTTPYTMKLISLNLWHGRIFEPLIKFIKDEDADIYCFQEVMDSKIIKLGEYRGNILDEIKKALPNHNAFFAPAQDNFFDGPQEDFSYGLAMFVRKSVTVDEMGDHFIFGSRNSKDGGSETMPRNLQYAKIGEYIIAHFHGLWNGAGKTDSDPRLEQSKKAKTFIDKMEGKKILCGDFNLLPDTESLAILSEGYDDLIKKHNITSTRSSLYKKPDKFADYTFVSDIIVEKFEVPDVEISDHLPMILHFS